MSGGVELYNKLTEVLKSNDLNAINSLVSTMPHPKILDNLSFYEVSLLLSEIKKYSRALSSSDPRGLGGKAKGAKKKDVMVSCQRAITILEKRKSELFELERKSQDDHSEKYREFLPRGITRDMDNQAANLPKARKKARVR